MLKFETPSNILIAMYVALSKFFYSHINLTVFINFFYTTSSIIYLFKETYV